MDTHPLYTLAVVLSAGLIGGELSARLKLPRVTGWILTGIALGALHLDGLELTRIRSFSPLTDFVLGYIAFTVGSHLNFRQLRNAGKRLVLIVATEATITPAIVIAAMTLLGDFPVEVAFVFAAIAVAGAPGTTLLVVREARARGVFVKTLIAAVALIDMVAVCLFVIIDSELATKTPIEGPGFIFTSLPYALRALGLAAGIGVAIAALVIALTRTIVGAKQLGAVLVAAIVLAWGVADLIEVSPILSVTFVGMALGNLMSDKEHAGESALNSFGDILFTAFYTLAGIRLDFNSVLPMAAMVGAFLGARFLGKVISSYVAMSAAGALKSVRNYLGIALMPHGGVAVGIILFAQNDPMLAAHADDILAIGLAALAVNQLIGPSATRFALSATREAGRDRPRLLDFLREQDIVTGFKASSKEQAIAKLVDILYQTHRVNMPKDDFLTAVLARDADASTCLGKGLMIPHGVVEDSNAPIVGVMALSSEGLDFETPDERPIHAIVLLATSTEDRRRHLEVLAAFARAIAGDRNISEQLYHARSPAHAYQLLHAGDAEDFNYFFEDAMSAGSTGAMPASADA